MRSIPGLLPLSPKSEATFANLLSGRRSAAIPKRWPWDGSVERGSQSNRRTKAVQGAMNRAPLECDSHTSDVPRQHLAASRLAGETKGFAKRTAPVAGKAARRTAPRRGRSTNGYGTWRRNEKRARRPFLNDLQTSLELYRSIFGAGDETGTRALNPCFPITFFAAVSSEGLNYSLVLRPRQQNSSNNFHQRPRTAISSPDNRRRIHGYQRPAPATPLDTQVSLRQEWHQHRTLRPRLV